MSRKTVTFLIWSSVYLALKITLSGSRITFRNCYPSYTQDGATLQHHSNCWEAQFPIYLKEAEKQPDIQFQELMVTVFQEKLQRHNERKHDIKHSQVTCTDMMGCVRSIEINDDLIKGLFKLLKKQNRVELLVASAYMGSNGEANNKSNSGKVQMKVKKCRVSPKLCTISL